MLFSRPTTTRNDNLEQQAQALFESLLQNCDDRIAIGEMAENILDYTPSKDEKVKLINSADITEGIFPNVEFVENRNLKGHFKKRFQYGDILYSEIRPRNHHYGYVLFRGDEYIVSTRFMIIRNKSNYISSSVLYQYLLMPEVEADFTAKTESRSGTFPQGDYRDMANIVVPYGDIMNTVDTSECFQNIRVKIHQNNVESEKLSQLRDAILPKLMSGDLKINDLNS